MPKWFRFPVADFSPLLMSRTDVLFANWQKIMLCKLAENHADELAPSVKSFAELVGIALAYDALDCFFRKSRYCLREKCYICRHKDKVFFLTAKVGKNSRPLPLSLKKIFRTLFFYIQYWINSVFLMYHNFVYFCGAN